MNVSEALEKLRQFRANSTQIDPPGVTVPLSLVRSAKLASWMAYWALVYFLLLYTFDIARDRAGTMHFTHVGFWTGDVQVYAPYLFGFVIVAVGIPYVAKIAIPTFMSLDWRMNFWPKMWALFIATAVSLVVIAGTFTVQGDTLLERDRESAVAVAQVEQSNAVLQAQIAAKEAELRSMMENSNAYLAQAASVGEAEWQRSYVAQTPEADPQRARIVRALGAARRADNLRDEIASLRASAAAATTTASVASRVTNQSNGWIADTLGWLEGARAILLSLVMDIVCLIMPWIALRLEQARNRQMEESGRAPAPETVMIEDHTADAPVTPQPMEKPREAVFDADTGEELQRITPRSYWRKKKGKPQQVQTAPEHVEDERGYEDARTAMAKSGAMPGEIDLAETAAAPVVKVAPEDPSSEEAYERSDEAQQNIGDNDSEHASQPTTEMSEEELAAGYAELDAQSEAPAADDAHTLPNNEGVLVDEDEVYGPPAPVRRELEGVD